jgi:hypothetical protein
MSLANLILTRATATCLPFIVGDGNVTFEGKPVLTWFNDTTILLPINARANFKTGEAHAHLDAALAVLMANKINILYPDSLAIFMNPKARFADWLDNKLTPASIGLRLSPEELAVPTAYKSAQAKFEAMFTAPVPPVPERLLDARPLADSQKLTVTMRNGAPRTITNGNHSMGAITAKKLWTDFLAPKWATRECLVNAERSLGSKYISVGGYSSREVRIHADRVVIGCQTIQRNQIEELAQRLDWPM